MAVHVWDLLVFSCIPLSRSTGRIRMPYWTSVVVYALTSSAEGPGSIPGRRIRSHTLQLRAHMPQLKRFLRPQLKVLHAATKILCAATKTQCRQICIYIYIYYRRVPYWSLSSGDNQLFWEVRKSCFGWDLKVNRKNIFSFCLET